MTEIFWRVDKLYKLLFYDLPVPWAKDYPVLSSAWLLLVVLVSYIYFCSSLGPKFMKDREPFKLKPVMIVYNLFQIFLSAFFFSQTLIYGWPTRYKLFCEPPEYSLDDPVVQYVSKLVLMYYISKIIDLLDTVFFILRKKMSHVTFLHLYHHAGMVFLSHAHAKYVAGGHLVMVGQVNSLVHVVMYTYYLLTSVSTNKKYVCWKKYLTQLQMAQFLLLIIHSLPTIMWDNCDYPWFPRVLMCVQFVFMFCMFSKFYTDTYIRKKNE